MSRNIRVGKQEQMQVPASWTKYSVTATQNCTPQNVATLHYDTHASSIRKPIWPFSSAINICNSERHFCQPPVNQTDGILPRHGFVLILARNEDELICEQQEKTDGGELRRNDITIITCYVVRECSGWRLLHGGKISNVNVWTACTYVNGPVTWPVWTACT